MKRWNIALIAGAGARSICTCSTSMCAFQSWATVQAVDRAASPALVLISGNKSLRMAMIYTPISPALRSIKAVHELSETFRADTRL